MIQLNDKLKNFLHSIEKTMQIVVIIISINKIWCWKDLMLQFYVFISELIAMYVSLVNFVIVIII